MSKLKLKPESQSKIDPVPLTGFLRMNQIIRVPGSDNVPLIPISRSLWLKGVAEGRFPKPIKLGVRSKAWKAEDIRLLIEELGAR